MLVVLLIFYIATTVFKQSQPKLNITVPNSTTAKPTQDTVPSTLYVTADDKIFLDDQPVEPDKLGEVLKSKKDANPDFKLATKIDEKASFKVLTQLFDAAKIANIPEIQAYMAPKAAGGPAQ